MGLLKPARQARNCVCAAALAVFPVAVAQTTATASLDADVAAVVQHEHLPGLAMAVVDNGQVVYRHAEGTRGDGGRIDQDTLFKIASNSKAMTAALLARLVQQGMLRWEDPVQQHLPGFRMHDAWVGEQMQVRDLLIHNSGLGLGAGDLMLWPEPNAFTRADIIAGLAHLKPVSSFRSRYAYDNLMYVVAGEVAAAAGGKPYDQLMREQVFEPLGMTRCQVGAWSVKRVGNVAQPHAWRGDRNAVVNADGAISPDLPSMAAGGIRCSLRDMTRWMQVLLDPTLAPGWLDAEQRRTLWDFAHADGAG